jgi:hypothetical protein
MGAPRRHPLSRGNLLPWMHTLAPATLLVQFTCAVALLLLAFLVRRPVPGPRLLEAAFVMTVGVNSVV